VGLIAEHLRAFHQETGKFGSITAAYDTELFGHWWFEGVAWLKAVLRGLALHPDVELTTASAIIEGHPPREVLSLPESSWGAGGGHYTWLNDETEWIWPLIHNAERRMEALVAANPDASGERQEILSQAARELLLLQSSDWPFLVTTGQANEYAKERFTEHLQRFNQLAELAEKKSLSGDDQQFLDALRERDNPFPDIDYRDWQERQGIAHQSTMPAQA
jgi:1,4-alpha-glucan branching enzyme